MAYHKDDSIVILTGAGVSAESGLSTFRDSGGLWEQYRIEEVCTPEALARNPALVQEFYNKRRAQLAEVEPNAAHHALARLAAEWPGEFLLVTQNVDDLHERALAEVTPAAGFELLHMHGELRKVRCQHSGSVFEKSGAVEPDERCLCCNEPDSLRPHIVFFGEMPLGMERIYAALERCRLFVSVGTSGSVYPAAGFVQEVQLGGRCHTVELNLEPSQGSRLFDDSRHGLAGMVVPAFVEELLLSCG